MKRQGKSRSESKAGLGKKHERSFEEKETGKESNLTDVLADILVNVTLE